MFWDWKYKETTTTKTQYNNLTSRSRESDKCKNNAVWYAIYLHQRHWGRESTYFGKWKGKNLEKSSKTQSWMNWDLKEVWHRQDGRKRNKEYRWNKPSLFLDFWKVLKYSPQFQRPSFYDQRWLLSLSHCFPRKNKNKKQYWLGMLLAAYINKRACPVGARVFSMSRSVVELVPGTVWSLTEWSHWWLRFFFVSPFCLFYTGLGQRLDLLLATMAISGNPTDMLTYSHTSGEKVKTSSPIFGVLELASPGSWDQIWLSNFQKFCNWLLNIAVIKN